MSGDLQKRVELLERKLAREKKARSLAEMKLEDYSRQIYLSNQELKRSLAHSRKKQEELTFLSQASAMASSELSLVELVHDSIEIHGNFLNALCGVNYIADNGILVSNTESPIWFHENHWLSDQTLYQLVAQAVPFDQKEIQDQWVICEANIESKQLEKKGTWVVSINYPLLDKKVGWTAYLLDCDILDEDTLYVLDTAKAHIRTGVTRRLDEKRLRQHATQLEHTVKKLEKAKMQLIHAEKMASLGRLAAGVAHEINNPVGFIKSNQGILHGYLQEFWGWQNELTKELEDNGKIDQQWFLQHFEKHDLTFIASDAEEILRENREGIERIIEIVSSLQTFSHGGTKEYEPVSLVDVIQKALKIVWGNHKYEHKVVFDESIKIPLILGNSGELQQVFINLLVNAAQAMLQPGTITITFDVNSETVTTSIRDSGIGMEQSTLQKIFTPFFTTKKVGDGTGLGLSVIQAIIESHNGVVTVESEKNVGSVFHVTIPILQD